MEAPPQIAFDDANNNDAGGVMDISGNSDFFAVVGSNSDEDVLAERGMLD